MAAQLLAIATVQTAAVVQQAPVGQFPAPQTERKPCHVLPEGHPVLPGTERTHANVVLLQHAPVQGFVGTHVEPAPRKYEVASTDGQLAGITCVHAPTLEQHAPNRETSNTAIWYCMGALGDESRTQYE